MCFGFPGPLKPPAAKDAPPAPAHGHRTKYIVIAVERAATYHDRAGQAVETDWKLTLRRADQGVPPRYTYYVEQRPELPAPAQIGAVIEIDPRLVDVERDA